MKKITAIIIAAVLILAAFTACGGAKEVDLKTVMNDINTQYGLSDLKNIEDADGLNRYYQIAPDDVKQFAAELTTAASAYSEVILVEGNDQTAADNIKAQLEAHLNSQLGNAKSYDADQVAMLEACSVKQNGNYVYLIIGDSHSEIEGTVEEALK